MRLLQCRNTSNRVCVCVCVWGGGGGGGGRGEVLEREKFKVDRIEAENSRTTLN